MTQSRILEIPTPDGLKLHAALWPAPHPRATVLISHGLGEHLGRYRHVAEALNAQQPVDVLAFDYRGHGRSPGRRGAVPTYSALLVDLLAALDFLDQLTPSRPRFLLGHSQGALQALRALHSARDVVDGLILSSPALEIAVPVPTWKRAMAHALRIVAPSLPIGGGLPSAWLATRPGYAEERAADPLIHNKVCAHVYFGMKAWGERMLNAAPELICPLLVVAGTNDPITPPPVARKLVERWGGPDATILELPLSAHEPLNDLDQHQAIAEISAWIAAHSTHDAKTPHPRDPLSQISCSTPLNTL